jgi:hypothetical protein
MSRLEPYVVGVLLVTMPALTLVAAFAVLTATRSALLDGLTALEVVELYLVELAMFAVFGYVLYRLMLLGARRQTHLAEDGEGRDAAGSERATTATDREPAESEPRDPREV